MNGVPDYPELLLRERAWLCALARQLVQRHEVADEAAHDALAAALTQASPQTAGPRAWLAAILKKQLAGRRRAEQRRQARERMAARPETLPPVSDTVLRFEVQRDVANAVLALAEPYRTTVLLRFWDGLSPAAIGTRLRVPVETVRTRLKRGLSLLRERLDREHGGDRRAWVVPLWLLGRRTGSVAASLLMGISLMTAMQKFVVGAAVAAAMILWLASPWSPLGVAVPVTEQMPPVVTADVDATPTAAAGPAATVAEANDRIAVPIAADAARLVVTGTIVDDDSGAPLPEVSVRLVCWPRDPGSEPEATTGIDGTFSLRDTHEPLHLGREVYVEASDFAVAHVRAPYERDREGQQTVDVGTVRLVRGTWFSGQVVDPEGRGVAAARLLLPRVSIAYGGGFYGPQHMLRRFVVLGQGDDAGRFRLAHPVGPDINHGNLLFAVTPQGLGWCRFEPSKQRREVSDLVVRLRPSGALRVSVLDPSGRPVAGLLVRALPRFGPLGIESLDWREELSDDPGLRARLRGTTDANGELVLSDLPIGEPSAIWNPGHDPRRYDLWIEAEGYPPQPLHRCEVQPGTEQRVAVRLLVSRRIAVTVDVRDDLGAPIDGALVEVLTERDAEARTDGEGRAILAVEAAPKLGLSASRTGYREAQQWIEPDAGATTLQATLMLARVHPLDGRVVDQFGAPAANMCLFVDYASVGRTDAQGRFHVDEFPMGARQLVVALAPGMDPTHWTGEQTPETVAAEQGPVTIVKQRSLGRVDVRVAIVDAATAGPLEPIEVMLRGYVEKVDSYALSKPIETTHGLVTSRDTPAGRWRLDVVTATGHRGSLPFALTDGQPPVDLRLELPAPGTITGHLRFLGVVPPANVRLGVRHATIERNAYTKYRYPGRWHLDAQSQTVVDDQFGGTGTLRLQPVQNPSFRLDVADPTDDLIFTVHGDGITGEATLRVQPGQTRDLVIEVRPKSEPPR